MGKGILETRPTKTFLQKVKEAQPPVEPGNGKEEERTPPDGDPPSKGTDGYKVSNSS